MIPGDHLYAIGPCRRAPSGEGGAFREGPQGQLVLYATQGDLTNELILTNKSEAQLVSSMFWGSALGGIVAGVGLVLVLSGVAAGFVG